MSFDTIAMVDWSATTSTKGGADSVWIAIARSGEATQVENVPRRREAMRRVETLAQDAVARGERLLVGFDFGFGYAKGSDGLPGGGRWQDVWAAIAEMVEDDEDNRSNRFDVASRLNAGFGQDAGGPFWNFPKPHEDRYANLTRTKPDHAEQGVREYRRCEEIARAAGRPSQPMWKLYTPGSVGSQSLLGIAHLQWLRAGALSQQIAIWPFETAFADELHAKPVVLAEIFPSLWPLDLSVEPIKDAAQVRQVAEGLLRAQNGGRLTAMLAGPSDKTLRQDALEFEGWIVGVGDDVLPLPDDAGYIRDPAAIYERSFAIVREEADLVRFSEAEKRVAIRMIHSCGMVDIVDDLEMSAGAVDTGIEALAGGAAIVTDVEMVRYGIIAARLPAENDVHCFLRDEAAKAAGKRLATTITAGGIEAAGAVLPGSVVVIGNAPTALFRLLEMIDEGMEPPALVVGIPVGFVGAVESKQALAAHGVTFITVHGRRGGSAMASAVVNALAGGLS